jgi:hypothetical protein
MLTRLTRHRTRTQRGTRSVPWISASRWGGGTCGQVGKVSNGVRHVRWYACIGLAGQSKLHPGWDLVLNSAGSLQPYEGMQRARVRKRCENAAASLQTRASAERLSGTAAARTHPSIEESQLPTDSGWLDGCKTGWYVR